jgi:hypothetical protein
MKVSSFWFKLFLFIKHVRVRLEDLFAMERIFIDGRCLLDKLYFNKRVSVWLLHVFIPKNSTETMLKTKEKEC